MFLVPSVGSGPHVRPVQQALGPDVSVGAQASLSCLQTRGVVGVVAATVVLAEAKVVESAVVGAVVWALVVEAVVIEASHVLDPRLQIGEVKSVQSESSQHSTFVLEVSHLYSHVLVSRLQMSSPGQSSSSEHSCVMHVPSSQVSPELQSSSTLHSGGIAVVVEYVVFESIYVDTMMSHRPKNSIITDKTT